MTGSHSCLAFHIRWSGRQCSHTSFADSCRFFPVTNKTDARRARGVSGQVSVFATKNPRYEDDRVTPYRPDFYGRERSGLQLPSSAPSRGANYTSVSVRILLSTSKLQRLIMAVDTSDQSRSECRKSAYAQRSQQVYLLTASAAYGPYCLAQSQCQAAFSRLGGVAYFSN